MRAICGGVLALFFCGGTACLIAVSEFQLLRIRRCYTNGCAEGRPFIATYSRLGLFRFGGLPCESRGSQVAPPDAVQTGAVVTPNAVRKHRMPLRTRGGSDASTQSSRQQPSALLPVHLLQAERRRVHSTAQA